ncbi:uncharacterized protein EV420DRAFT_1482685 [Desarmillaria tabescens]|uniref:CCHC-type domain-containing protein n=1 Tax=Armillaria tabescens TaxID=1929756 RepID=A0AA39K1K1_ARMTA|nr:uncharacterized protein EV420DRAFT_1482685 [Desarmillaria tabescens]KAK0450478.1 hypothetical protein EV420DRAFT_1482685 [Desarmillaria tabescens]
MHWKLQAAREAAECRLHHEAEVAAGIVPNITRRRQEADQWDLEAEIEPQTKQGSKENCTDASLELDSPSSSLPGSTRPATNFSSNLNSQPQQNPTQPQSLNMATKRQMPMESSRDAPRLETSDPRAIRKHFRIMEGMFKIYAGVDTDEEKKDWAVHYTSMDIEDQWRAFPTFEAGKTWEDFKEEVLRSYDGAAEDDEDARKGLIKVAHKYKREGIMDSADYLNYSKGVPGQKNLGLEGTRMPVYNELFNGSLPKVDSSPKVEAPGASASRGIMTLKKEPAPAALSGELHNFLAEMADSNRLIVKLLENQVTSQGKRDEELHKMLAQIKAQPRPTQPAPAPSTRGQFGSNAPGNCHFCETPGHYQVDCPYKLEMITTRELVHVPGTQNIYRLRDGNPPPREPAGMSQKARIQHYYETHKASGSNQVGQTYIVAPQLPGPVPQYVMSHQIAEEKEDIGYLRNMLEKLVQQTSHLAPDKVDQYLEGPRWESVVKTRGQQCQEASQANDTPQDTQDFHKRSMKAGEHHKKAAAVAGPVDSSPEDVIQNQKRGAEAENWRSRPKLQSKYTPNSSSNNDENLVPGDPDVVDRWS